jgi:hypothetical protein
MFSFCSSCQYALQNGGTGPFPSRPEDEWPLDVNKTAPALDRVEAG